MSLECGIVFLAESGEKEACQGRLLFSLNSDSDALEVEGPEKSGWKQGPKYGAAGSTPVFPGRQAR